MNNTVLLAVIFPANMPFFNAFIRSVAAQTDKFFDVLIANDGVDERLIIEGLQNVSITAVIGSPIQTRLSLLEEAEKRGYKKFIFTDTDDELSENRVEIIKALLEHTACVCNDVDLIDTEGKYIVQHYWKSRLADGQCIDNAFLMDKNVIGFGNTGLTVEAFRSMNDVKPVEMPAPDWYYFSLLAKKHQVWFTSKCTTRYRQHADNLIGIKSISSERLHTIINVKLQHYQALENSGYKTGERVKDILALQTTINSAEGLAEALQTLQELNINYFWWEETNYLV